MVVAEIDFRTELQGVSPTGPGPNAHIIVNALIVDLVGVGRVADFKSSNRTAHDKSRQTSASRASVIQPRKPDGG